MGFVTIVVCIKQVPATNEVKIDPATGNLIRDSVAGVMNSFDKNAVEEAVRLKEKTGARLVALSMGPPQFRETLREALALGCDEAFLLSSPAMAGADTLATAYVLAKAIEKVGEVSLALFGRHAEDADTGQVGPLVAEMLALPQVTFARNLELTDDGCARVVRQIDQGEETILVKLPAVITVTCDLNSPRYPLPVNIMKAAKKEVPVLTEKELGCDPERIGLKGSRTLVSRIFAPVRPPLSARMLTGSPREAAGQLADSLSQKIVI